MSKQKTSPLKITANTLKLSLMSSLSVSLFCLPVFAQNGTQDGVNATSSPVSTENSTGDTKSSDELEEIVITGSKLNLMNAQEMKREADTMIDAISADQIGLLPDRSSLDAMQRLPGVAIERFAAPNDPDHYSVEGSKIILRGMDQTRSEFNGRDSFSAYSGRGLSYSDIPPELLGSIQVFKNQTADMVEGGIGGTVNLITKKPLDSDGQEISFSVDYSYGDLAQTWSPTFSGLYSNVFDSPIGKWGVLLNYVNSELVGESHGLQSATYLESQACRFVTEGNTNPVGTRAIDFVEPDGYVVGESCFDYVGSVWAPGGANILMKEDTRDRQGLTAAIQFESDDGRIRGLAEYIRSDSTLAWSERAIKYQGGYFNWGSRPSRPLDGTHFLFDEDGLFVAGTIAEEANPWRVASSGRNRVPTDGGVEGFDQWGHKVNMDSRLNETRSLVEDFSVNLQFDVTDRLTLEGDIQFIQADAEVDDMSIHLGSWAMFDFDTRGSIPSLRYIEPWNGVRDNDPDSWNGVDENGQPAFPGFGGDPAGDRNYFQDDDSYHWQSAMDHYERSEGESLATRLDVDFEVGDGWLRRVKAGYRFSEREQTVRSTSWNWGALAPGWSKGQLNWELEDGEYFGSGIGWVPDVHGQRDGVEVVDWSNFMGGGVVQIPGNRTLHANEALLRAVIGGRSLYQSPLSDGNNTP